MIRRGGGVGIAHSTKHSHTENGFKVRLKYSPLDSVRRVVIFTLFKWGTLLSLISSEESKLVIHLEEVIELCIKLTIYNEFKLL